MKKLRPQVLLMLFTILGVAGFQFFWLKQTYAREQKNLELKTDFAFRDAILGAQASGLKLRGLGSSGVDTAQYKNMKLMSGDSSTSEMTVRLNEEKGVISTINVISRKMSDSLKVKHVNNAVFIRRDHENSVELTEQPDETGKHPAPDHIVQLLYGVDSLQKPLEIKDITAAVTASLKKQEINIPFTISKRSTDRASVGFDLNEVTIGLAHPVVYHLEPGNTFFYLLKRISMPILFSILLLGLTIASFWLLYRNLRRQQQLTDIKNEFIANITHELKTPIATVSVAIEALQGFDALQEPVRAKEYLGIAGQELGRLSMMVDKVLRLSMFENHAAELKHEDFDLAGLTQEVMKTMQLQIEKHHAETTFTLKGVDFMICADRLHIASVLYNLIDNAIKYSPGNPVINISITAENNFLTLKVADEGIGIDPAYRDKIFEKFFRVPHGNLHNVKGYGLGLSYAAHITRQHGGSIHAESNGAHGTAFIIKLPRNNDC